MKKNVLAPAVGESITEVSILKWTKPHGSAVKNGEVILEIESDKATVEVIAEQDGVLQILKQEGERVPIGEIVAVVDNSITPSAGAPAVPKAAPSAPPPLPHAPAPHTAPPPPLPRTPTPSAPPPPLPGTGSGHSMDSVPGLSPAVRRAAAQHGINPAQISGTGKDGRVTKGDILTAAVAPISTPVVQTPTPSAPAAPVASKSAAAPAPTRPGDRRVPMSLLRQRIAERLVSAQHNAAILTTFNEVDLSAVMKIRAANKDAFKAKHGVSLSFMSFFSKASVAALKAIPEVNATIDGKDIIYHDYIDLGIAVGTERGLVVPIIRGADQMGFVEIEKSITELAIKARDGKLSIADMTGGTFTISNGGTYGSLMSTPILNPPQSGILGMHKIMDRPIAVNGNIEIRPMMYIALSYDHRLIDGKGAVTWLVQLKEHLENPEKLAFSF